MRFSRYQQIVKMTQKRPLKAGPEWPQGYGYGDWHQAFVDITSEIEHEKWKSIEVTIGRKSKGPGTTESFKLGEMLDEDLHPNHLATRPTQEEWQALIKRLLPMIKKPDPEGPEVSADERALIAKDKAIDDRDRRIAELEQNLAKAQSAAAN